MPEAAQDAAFRRLADLAPTLKEAELRVLLYLITVMDGQRTAVASSRQIAAAANVSRTAVKHAIDILTRRQFITTRDGSADRSSAYLLSFAATSAFKGGSLSDPPLGNELTQGGPTTGPPLGNELTRPGSLSDPPLIETAPLPPTPPAVDIDISTDLFDRIHRAAPTHTDPALIAHAREWLCGYMRKFGRSESIFQPRSRYSPASTRETNSTASQA